MAAARASAFFFSSKMRVGEEKKSVGPAWQWDGEKTLRRLGDGLLFFSSSEKGRCLSGPF